RRDLRRRVCVLRERRRASVFAAVVLRAAAGPDRGGRAAIGRGGGRHAHVDRADRILVRARRAAAGPLAVSRRSSWARAAAFWNRPTRSARSGRTSAG